MTTPTREQVVQWGREAGVFAENPNYTPYDRQIDEQTRFATLARADLEAQLAEKDALLKDHGEIQASLCSQLTAAQAEIAALKEQVEKVTRYWQVAEGRCDALKEDAERYVALRSALYREDIEIGEAYLRLRVIGACPSGEQFDAAIDKARKEK